MTRKQVVFLLVGALVLLGFIAGIYGYKRHQANATQGLAQQNAEAFNRAHAPTYGPATAKVRITEFFDPACETCRAFYPMVKRLVDAEQGRVQLVVRFLPLHTGSKQAAEILLAADMQQLFWPVAQVVLNSQDAWASHDRPNPDLLWGFLQGTALDLNQAQADIKLPKVQEVLRQDLADARALNVTKTPGFFVNGKPLEEFGYGQLQALVQQELRLAYPQ